MRLTDPIALWGLLLLAIPPLLARMRVPRPRRAVANLYLWQDLDHSGRTGLAIRRIRRDRQAALQAAVLLAIVVALAGPVLATRTTPPPAQAAAGPRVALSRLVVRRHPLTPTSGDVLIEVRNFGSDAEDARIELSQDGSVIGRDTMHAPGRGTATIIHAVPTLGRLLTARIVTDGSLAAGSSRFAAVPDQSPIRVRLLSRGHFFLEKVLAANTAIALVADTRAAVDVVVCDDCTAPPATGESALVIPPSGSSMPPTPLTIAKPDHPLVAALGFGEWLVAPPASGSIPADGEILLRAGGQPVAVASERHGQRVLELRLDAGSPGLALQSEFPILMANAIAWLAAREENQLDVAPGDVVSWRLAGAFSPGQVSVAGPDGRPVDGRVEGRFLTVARTTAPGPYVVRTPLGEQIFVVNAATGLDAARAEGMPHPASGGATGKAGPMDEQALAPWLLALACGLLALEWHDSRTWSGRIS